MVNVFTGHAYVHEIIPKNKQVLWDVVTLTRNLLHS